MRCGIVIALACVFAAPPIRAAEPPIPVDRVDLRSYAGLWYEIARLPNRFQKSCDRFVTAEYRLDEDGGFLVINRCLEADGELKEARGRARVVNPPHNSRLEVSFVRLLGKNLFWGDYWILGLGERYEYAVIGHPERKYGWILSRNPTLEPAERETINEVLRAQGYDPDAFVFEGSARSDD